MRNKTTTVVFVAAILGLVFAGLAFYEYSFWHYVQHGPSSSTHGTSVGGNQWLRIFVTHPLYHSAGCVLGPTRWLISAIYGLVTAVASAIGFMVSRRMMIRKSICSVIIVGSAALAAVVMTVVFEGIWSVFIENLP